MGWAIAKRTTEMGTRTNLLAVFFAGLLFSAAFQHAEIAPVEGKGVSAQGSTTFSVSCEPYNAFVIPALPLTHTVFNGGNGLSSSVTIDLPMGELTSQPALSTRIGNVEGEESIISIYNGVAMRHDVACQYLPNASGNLSAKQNNDLEDGTAGFSRTREGTHIAWAHQGNETEVVDDVSATNNMMFEYGKPSSNGSYYLAVALPLERHDKGLETETLNITFTSELK